MLWAAILIGVIVWVELGLLLQRNRKAGVLRIVELVKMVIMAAICIYAMQAGFLYSADWGNYHRSMIAMLLLCGLSYRLEKSGVSLPWHIDKTWSAHDDYHVYAVVFALLSYALIPPGD